jgi:uncharacterized membrane protein YfcA
VFETLTTSASLAPLFEPRLLAAVVIAVLAGVVRGFSGFGGALIYVPLASAVYDPKVAIATLFLLDAMAATPFAIHAFPRCNWRDVLPLAIAASVMVPVGAAALDALAPATMRWIIAVIVLSALAVLASGWRYHGRPRLAITVAVGALAGLFGGASQMSGPPVIAYWLGGATEAAVVRANLMVFFALTSITSGTTYLLQGLFTPTTLLIALVVGPVYGLAMIVGARLFQGAGDGLYRGVAYLIIAAAAVISLPIFDHVLR